MLLCWFAPPATSLGRTTQPRVGGRRRSGRLGLRSILQPKIFTTLIPIAKWCISANVVAILAATHTKITMNHTKIRLSTAATFAGAAVFVFSATAAKAAILASDSFDYALGPIAGLNGGTGFSVSGLFSASSRPFAYQAYISVYAIYIIPFPDRRFHDHPHRQ